MVQWLGLSALTAMGPGSIPGWGTKIPQAERHGQNNNNSNKENNAKESGPYSNSGKN